MNAVPAIIVWGLFALLLTLKLTGLAAISWWAVTAPLWIAAIIAIVACIAVVVLTAAVHRSIGKGLGW